MGIDLQVIPIYGLSFGVLYYNPNLEPDNYEVEEDDMYHQITIMIFVFGFHITWWKTY